MHIIQAYSLQGAQKISKPSIQDTFFPLGAEKYISFSPISKPAKTFSYWNTVTDILFPLLEKEDIKIVQLGGKDEPPVRNCIHLQGKTSYRQTAYLVKNSILHFGVDTFTAHLAGIYDKPLVALYAANYIDCVRPFWGNREKQLLLEADRKNDAPSFAFDENPRTIDRIPIEKVAECVCKLLNIKFDFPYSTILVGPAFQKTFLENIPDQAVDPQTLGVDTMICRMDILYNEQALVEQAKVSKVVIITDKPINIDLLKAIKSRVSEIAYEVKEENDPNWVQKVQRLGIKIGLFTFLGDEELKKHKLKYLDLPLINQKKLEKHPLLSDIPNNEIVVASNRFILSNSKIYPSLEHYRQNVTLPSFDLHFSPFIDSYEFLKEADCFWFLRKKA